MFSKILIANRGEVAVRIIRACKEMGIETVAVYSEADQNSLPVALADERICIGSNAAADSYLNQKNIISAALASNAEAIHPGYGFLSENSQLAKRCAEEGFIFIGPRLEHLIMFGDKINARTQAELAGIPMIPGSDGIVSSVEEVRAFAEKHGFPIIIKAVNGGGGRGMRMVASMDELDQAYSLAKSEALKAFGSDEIYLEKYLQNPKHIEVQIIGDTHGNIVHLHERDCSVQRRHQKLVEVAPAFSLPQQLRSRICEAAVKLMKNVDYISAGTVEFLATPDNNFYFIEVNPRIQVEHTVTEEITGIDIVQTQIKIAEGYALHDPEIAIPEQKDIITHGHAIQCRITTEDPANNFMPDTGKLIAYRSGGGFGVRLDGGNAYTGAEISPYYDSLLVKVTSWDNTFEGVCRKAMRAISEEHVRGVKTNIPFVTNILAHPTKFIDETPELFDIDTGRDRATKVLKYIAQIQVDSPSAERQQLDIPRFPPYENTPPKCTGLKQLLDTKGPEAVRDWVLDQKKLLITDTTMRDAHQSLLSTRVRTRDMLKASEGTAEILNDCFSLEMWGGATFDVAYRFLHESPWERLRLLREKIPNIPFQMLLRGANAVGYTNYPDNLIRAFIKEACIGGIDVFRIFDSLNWIPGMEVAMDEVLKQGKLCEATICYTGDILDPKRDKYTLEYYVNMAKELEKRGAHLLCIKDMSGLLKPYAAKKLVSTLKQEIGIPIHLHTHDTSGNQVAAYLMAAEAGVDIVDCAIDSMSSMTSQPSMNAVVTALQGQERDTGLDPEKLQKLSDYWADVRLRYSKFEAGIKNPSTDIYRYEMPGGQYTNLKSQVESIGLGHQFEAVKEMYKTVNHMLGDIVKVTPSSKMVGDLAIFMVQNNLTPENILERGEALTFPDSVVSYFKGMMGQPAWGFPEDLQKVVLKGEEPITCRPGELLEPIDFEKAREEVRKFYPDASDHNVISWCLYPKVVEDFYRHRQEYGYVMRMGSHVFFNGMALGETNKINIEDGKTLVIKYLGLGEVDKEGMRTVSFELNGIRRDVQVPDEEAQKNIVKVPMADPEDKSQVGSSIPGAVSRLNVKVGDTVEKNQTLVTIEAMKMETAITARMSGTVSEILVKEGETVKGGQLILVIK